MLYAIVDIETTGGYAQGHGITEIAIVIHDGNEILNFFETLVNPNVPIPSFIQSLTGITDKMVLNAPKFQEVAAQVFDLLQDKIFIAHNVNFDYSFVKHQLQQSGYELDTKKLCTVRLSRKIFPDLNGYSLGKLCHQLNINIANRHRAGGDAMATAVLFSKLLKHDKENVIATMLKGRNKEQYLPPHLPVENIDHLPSQTGVYYFYNAQGKVIYIGKAKNIKRRVRSHFSNNKTNKQKQDFLREVHKISYKECATELMAHILESTEIRKLWPAYNRSQRGYLPLYGLLVYEDMQGFKRLAIEKNKRYFKPIYTFNTLDEGQQWLKELIAEFDLCARMCNRVSTTQCTPKDPTEFCKGPCPLPQNVNKYNKKVDAAIQWIKKNLPTFALVDKGIDDNEHSCILMKEGTFYGMGYIPDKKSLKNLEQLEKHLEPLQGNDFIRNLIYKHAIAFPEKRVSF
jgi:DNA polymerase-3 subunit epsilon